ncbi:hypothetical protein D3C80_1259720 [compost metagenome]
MQDLAICIEQDDDRCIVAVGDKLRRCFCDGILSFRHHRQGILVDRTGLRLKELVDERPNFLLPFPARALEALFGLLGIEEDEA